MITTVLRYRALLIKPRFVRLNFFTYNYEKATFTRRLVAQKIKEKAVLVVDRTGNDNLTEICAALHVAFGILDLDYELLSENCNPMRQGNIEQIKKLSFAI